MKIGMPKNGEMLNQHFGQSKEFMIATIEDGKITDRKEINSEALQHNHGGLSNLFVSEGVSLVIVGGIGQPALQALTMNRLQVIKGASGRYEDVLAAYVNGELVDRDVSCNHHGDHHHHH
ncbi:MAG: dinitrogenase iron-molybdenum cofactor family protein [Firmicutes bacterium]|nr:dinitrogenase iron-molybdenum cofactor family protein [Bacillota bacterium]